MIENPKLTAVNPHFKNRYAPLDEVLRVVKEGLSEGQDVRQTVVANEHGTFFRSALLSDSGSVEAFVDIPFPQTSKAQELGSAITYCRRYGLCLLFNLVGEDDDDGNAAQGKPSKKTKTKKIEHEGGYETALSGEEW